MATGGKELAFASFSLYRNVSFRKGNFHLHESTCKCKEN